MNKIKLITNRGKVHDWLLNLRLNILLWHYQVDDVDTAIYVIEKAIKLKEEK